jgi:hypothetical protein
MNLSQLTRVVNRGGRVRALGVPLVRLDADTLLDEARDGPGSKTSVTPASSRRCDGCCIARVRRGSP